MTDAEAIATAERIVARVAKGVPLGCEMSAEETRQMIAAYVLMREAASAAAEALQDAKARAVA